MKQRRKIIGCIFIAYIIVTLRLIIFKYPFNELNAITEQWNWEAVKQGLRTANLTPFKTIHMYIKYRDRLNSFENLFGNVLLFVPFGLFFGYFIRSKCKIIAAFLGCFLFSFGIELFQLVSGFGVFDVDDILLNVIGGMFGYLIYRFMILPNKVNIKKFLKGKRER